MRRLQTIIELMKDFLKKELKKKKKKEPTCNKRLFFYYLVNIFIITFSLYCNDIYFCS